MRVRCTVLIKSVNVSVSLRSSSMSCGRSRCIVTPDRACTITLSASVSSPNQISSAESQQFGKVAHDALITNTASRTGAGHAVLSGVLSSHGSHTGVATAASLVV